MLTYRIIAGMVREVQKAADFLKICPASQVETRKLSLLYFSELVLGTCDQLLKNMESMQSQMLSDEQRRFMARIKASKREVNAILRKAGIEEINCQVKEW